MAFPRLFLNLKGQKAARKRLTVIQKLIEGPIPKNNEQFICPVKILTNMGRK